MAIKNIKKTIANGLVKQTNWTERRKLGTANILNKLDRMQFNRAWLQVLVSPSLLKGYAIYDKIRRPFFATVVLLIQNYFPFHRPAVEENTNTNKDFLKTVHKQTLNDVSSHVFLLVD